MNGGTVDALGLAGYDRILTAPAKLERYSRKRLVHINPFLPLTAMRPKNTEVEPYWISLPNQEIE